MSDRDLIPRTSAPEPADGESAERHAVIVGINRYRHSSIRDLAYARADAEGVYRILVDPELGRFAPHNVTLLLDEDATARNIVSAIGTHLRKRAAERDLVCIFYAGHGAIEPDLGSDDGLQKYLVPCDGEADDLYSTAIPMSRIEEFFRRIASDQVICFLDCCYSGGANGRTFTVPNARTRSILSSGFLERLGKSHRGRFVVSSCSPNEVSIESADLDGGHGVFTHQLLQGLKGAADRDRDGLVTMDELFLYLSETVPGSARRLGGRMTPIRAGLTEGAVYLTRCETEEQRAARHALRKSREAEREREAVAARQHSALLAHFEAGSLTAKQYRTALVILAGKSDDLSETQREMCPLVDLLVAGRISPEQYVAAAADVDRQSAAEPVTGHVSAGKKRTPTRKSGGKPVRRASTRKRTGRPSTESKPPSARKRREPDRAVLVPELVRVEGGTFNTGKRGLLTRPREVSVSGFWIGRFPVTVREFSCYRTGFGSADSAGSVEERLPITNVSWFEAVAYCEWLSQNAGSRFRLPTEAEWEYAARGGRRSRRLGWAGSNRAGDVAWLDRNADGRAHPVGQKAPNELGLFDMSGNVAEWCADVYAGHDPAPRAGSAGDAAEQTRVLRGGSWKHGDALARVDARDFFPPLGRFDFVGFRVIRDIDAE